MEFTKHENILICGGQSFLKFYSSSSNDDDDDNLLHEKKSRFKEEETKSHIFDIHFHNGQNGIYVISYDEGEGIYNRLTPNSIKFYSFGNDNLQRELCRFDEDDEEFGMLRSFVCVEEGNNNNILVVDTNKKIILIDSSDEEIKILKQFNIYESDNQKMDHKIDWLAGEDCIGLSDFEEVKVLNVEKDVIVNRLDGIYHHGHVPQVSYDEKFKTLYSCSLSGVIMAWNVKAKKDFQKVEDNEYQWKKTIKFAPIWGDRCCIVGNYFFRNVLFYDFRNPQKPFKVLDPGKKVRGCSTIEVMGNDKFAISCAGGKTQIWNKYFEKEKELDFTSLSVCYVWNSGKKENQETLDFRNRKKFLLIKFSNFKVKLLLFGNKFSTFKFWKFLLY